MPNPPWAAEAEPARQESESRPSASPAYGSSSCPAGLPDSQSATTVLNLWRQSTRRFPKRPCLGTRSDASNGKGNYRFQTYKDVDRAVRKIAGPLEIYTSTDRKNIGIFSGGCPEWMIGFLGCMRAGLCAVPIHDSPGTASVHNIISSAEPPLIMASAATLGRLASILETNRGIVKCVVYWPWAGISQEEISEQVSALMAFGCEVLAFHDFLQRTDIMLGGPRADSLATILYSRDSAGDLNGVMLTHGQITTCLAAFKVHLKHVGLKLRPKDSFLAYLPLAHSFEMCMELTMLVEGGRIGYSMNGEPKSILEEAQVFKPTVFLGVPNVVDHLVGIIETRINASSFFGLKLLFQWGYRRKRAFIAHGIPVGKASPVFDTLVFRRFHGLLGGRQRFMLNFGTPLTSSAQEYLTVCMRCPCLQGYGSREGLAMFVPHPIGLDMIGTVGMCLPSVTWRVESLPDLGLDALDEQNPAGELVVRSPQLFKGYYKEPDLAKARYDEDGWFHTGDIGFVKDGCFEIIDLKENMLALADGRSISGAAVEKKYRASPIVSQIWVYGDSKREGLVGIVVPDKDALLDWAKSEGNTEADYEMICSFPSAVEFVMHHLEALAMEQGLCRELTVQAVRLSSQSLTVDDHKEFLSQASKFNRYALAKRFEKEIQEMYHELEQTHAPTPMPAEGFTSTLAKPEL